MPKAILAVVELPEVLQVQLAPVFDIQNGEVGAPGFLIAVHDDLDGILITIRYAETVKQVGYELLGLGPDTLSAVCDVHRSVGLEVPWRIGDLFPLLTVLLIGWNDRRHELLPGRGKGFIDFFKSLVRKVAGEELPCLELELGRFEDFEVVGLLGELLCEVEVLLAEIGPAASVFAG